MTTADEPMARVSISRILEKLTGVETTLAVVARDVRALKESTHEELADLDARMRTLEADRFPWKVIGGIVAVLALALSVATFVVSQDDGPPGPPPGSSTTK